MVPKEQALTDVQRWVHEFVVGEGLCPFARPTLQKTAFRVCEKGGLEPILLAFEEALNELLRPDADAPESTLLIINQGLEAFDDYLDTLDVLNHALAEAELDGTVQIASFHPEYCFEASEPDALSNYTNRSPWPVFHLLKEASVTQAVEGFPDVDNIPVRNIAHLEKLGFERVQKFSRRG